MRGSVQADRMKCKEGRKLIAVVAAVIMIPVMVSLITGRLKNTGIDGMPKSGKTIVADYGRCRMEMDMESFIPCVLMAQMSVDTPAEMLKAQSVVIRTYILKQMGDQDKISTDSLQLPFLSYAKLEEIWFTDFRLNHSSTLIGMFGNLTGMGKSKIFQQNMEYLKKIINETKGKILKKDGQLILPLFHEISNGTTRGGEDILGAEYNYLKSVKCDTDCNEEGYLTKTYISLEEIKEKMTAEDIIIYKDGKEIFSIEDMNVDKLLEMTDCTHRDESGYLLTIKIGDTRIMATEFANGLSLPSTAMEIDCWEDGICVTTKGRGHGFGLSLSCAKSLAEEGLKWEDILKTFYDASICQMGD